MGQSSVQRVFVILSDQLSCEHPFLKMSLNPLTDRLLMVESLPEEDTLQYHPQKILFTFACMRRFAIELRKEKPDISLDYVEFSQSTFAEVVNRYSAVEVHFVDPCGAKSLHWIQKDLLAKCVVHANPFFLSDDSMLQAKPPYLMETFYRAMRTKFGILMHEGKPLGGKWNYDEENRLAPLQIWEENPPEDFLKKDWCDQTDVEIYKSLEKTLQSYLPRERFGKFQRPTLPTHSQSAQLFLSEFVSKRLDFFGPYEDAMIAESVGLFHSGLSPMMNLQIISPREILAAVASAPDDVPLSSKEGFVRQVLGWREFVRLVYLRHEKEYQSTNFFGFSEKLPPLYWGHATRMNCLSTVVNQVKETSYSHHITRLMVLGNFALLSHTDPHEVNRWFWAVYLDAFEWVVTPNVLGMSQFADGGVFATKPYVSGANYINKMSRFCKKCSYDPKKTLGDDACPFNSLYWDFIDTTRKQQAHRASFARRMGMMWSVWEKKADEEKSAIRLQAESLRKRARLGEL